MDARERLRLYLEQRRELGESELVLDGLAVDDVLAVLGARAPRVLKQGAGAAPSASTTPTKTSSFAHKAPERAIASAAPVAATPPAAVEPDALKSC